jgi:hypothetical protein
MESGAHSKRNSAWKYYETPELLLLFTSSFFLRGSEVHRPVELVQEEGKALMRVRTGMVVSESHI